MNISVFKKVGIVFASIVVVFYVLFLIVPFFLTGFINSYSDDISKLVEDSLGFKVKLDKIQIITTPKLTAGVKVGHIDLMLPSKESILTVDNAQGKLSLLPLIIGRIELDKISADSLKMNLKIEKDGKFLIENYLPKPDESLEKQQEVVQMPFGIKLSNNLPDIVIKNYDLSFIDMQTDKIYSISGKKAQINDFVFNKKVKITIDGKITLDGREQFHYDVNVFNKVMPAQSFNDLVFSPVVGQETNNQNLKVNPIDIFEAIYANNITADVQSKVKVFGELNDIQSSGFLNVSNLGLAVDGDKLPVSNLALEFKGNKIKINTKLYSAKDELTQIIGYIKTGKKAHVDLTCKSNARFASLVNVIDSIAKSIGYKELDTLTATGGIDAEFNIKSNMKKIESSGYLKIPSSSFVYKLYDIVINNVNADIDFSDNSFDIKKAGLIIAGQPLSVKGKINSNAVANINIIADKLQIKGLVAAAGQMALLKDNSINSGTLSVDTSLNGRLDKIQPKVNISADNINIYNKPSSTSIVLAGAKIDIATDGKKADGKIKVNNLNILNPIAKLSIPLSQITLGEKDIIFDNVYVMFDNSKIDITGKIADYMTKKLAIDIQAKGAILADDVQKMIPADLRKDMPAKGSMPIYASITGNNKAQKIDIKLNANNLGYVSLLSIDQLKEKSTIINSSMKLAHDSLKFSDTGIYANSLANPIVNLSGSINNLSKNPKLDLKISTPNQISFEVPGFKKSKILAKGDISVLGNINIPVLKGNISIPLISLPDMLLTMDNMQVSLNGPIVSGKGTLAKLKSGGIVAENLSANFNLKNNVFYLKNIVGDAFDGKIGGNVSYNISNGKIGVNFNGSGLNAVKAIEGAAGIKNALSGKLAFTANITTSGTTDVEMMKALKGKVTFNIDDGTLANIGRFENFMFANNIMANAVMKIAVIPIVNLPAVKNTSQFKYISGNMTFSNGWANLHPIKMSGPSMSYYITGKYNLLNGTANVIILGRLSADVVKLLGPIGDLSVDKLTSFIPKFGALTSNIIKAMTTNPKGENISAIPTLSNGNTNYKDFKVIFNGGVESKSSVKSFKWLSECDISDVEAPSLKEQINNTKKTIEETRQKTRENFQNSLEASRQRALESKKQMQDAKNNLNNLKNLLRN